MERKRTPKELAQDLLEDLGSLKTEAEKSISKLGGYNQEDANYEKIIDAVTRAEDDFRRNCLPQIKK